MGKRILGVCLALVLMLLWVTTLGEEAGQLDRSALAEGCRTVGSYVTFGTYPQTVEGDDATPIEWLVLTCDEAGGQALLLSRYGLDALPFHMEWEAVVWETCSLRAWLNHDFLQTAFTQEEQVVILTTMVDNGKEQGYKPYAPKNLEPTRDKLFLLSFAEAKLAFGGLWEDTGNTLARTAPTPYAARKGVIVSTFYELADGQGTAVWWLRSGGNSNTTAAAVDSAGKITNFSVSNKTNPKLVRPAMWLDLNALVE